MSKDKLEQPTNVPRHCTLNIKDVKKYDLSYTLLCHFLILNTFAAVPVKSQYSYTAQSSYWADISHIVAKRKIWGVRRATFCQATVPQL